MSWLDYKEKCKRMKNIVPYLIAGIVSIIVSIPLMSNAIDLDEAYSIHLVRQSVKEIIQGTAADVHPPLYYLILKLTSFMGNEEVYKYRFLTLVATYLNLLWIGATKVRKIFGNRVACIYILWFGLNYCTVERTVSLRMYSWAAFFVTAVAIYLYEYYLTEKYSDFAIGIMMTLGAMYTHYYAIIAVVITWLIMLIATIFIKKNEAGKVIIGGIIVTIGYMPWMGSLLSQSTKVSENYWIQNFSWKEWALTPIELMESSLDGIGMALYVLLIAIFIVAIVNKNYVAGCALVVFVGTMLLPALLSVMLTPIWQARYLYVAWGMLSLFVAITIGRNPAKTAFVPQIGTIVILMLVGCFSVNNMLQSETMVTEVDAWMDFVEANISEDDCIIINDHHEHYLVYEYYMPKNKIIMAETIEGLGGKLAIEDILEKYEEHKVWYIVNYTLAPCATDTLTELLDEIGYETKKVDSHTIKWKVLDAFEVGVQK
ncbi:MAG: hypothetical protein E7299_07225 [Lachnospiraceae bacterium]|nr:hypothetical protein [Lachnospiraceae bacterium]